MHLNEARIDLNGSIIVSGRMWFPVDRDEVFDLPQHECLILGINELGASLTIAKAERDARTGFLVSEPLGPTLRLPRAVGSTLWQALRFKPAGPIKVSATDHYGSLTTKLDEHRHANQFLSDVRMKLHDKDGTIHVSVSAALESIPRPSPWSGQDPAPQYWEHEKGRRARVTVKFTVDLITRAVAFGSYHRSLEKVCGPPQPLVSQEITALHLGSALFGNVGRIYAEYTSVPMAGARWASVYSSGQAHSRKILMISSYTKLIRNAAGMIDNSSYDDKIPVRLELPGISLEATASLLLQLPELSIERAGEKIGYIDITRATGMPTRLKSVRVRFSLDRRGLLVELRAHCPQFRQGTPEPEWFNATFYISWAILTVRFGGYAERRRDFVRVPADRQIGRGT